MEKARADGHHQEGKSRHHFKSEVFDCGFALDHSPHRGAGIRYSRQSKSDIVPSHSWGGSSRYSTLEEKEHGRVVVIFHVPRWLQK